MSSPLVSVIIPTYDRAHIIGETLDSIIAQTYQNWECIVVDDGSTDGTDKVMAAYIAKDNRIQYHHRPKDRLSGGNEARNYGFELSKGKYINWFDSDDLMHPEKLEMNVAQFCNDPELIVSISAVRYIAEEGYKERPLNLATTNLYEDYVLKKIAVSCQVPLWSKAFLEGRTLFNPTTLKAQEYELYSELFRHVGNKFGLIAEPLVLIRKNENSITDQYNQGADKYIESYNFVLQKNLVAIIEGGKKKMYIDYLAVYYKHILHCTLIGKYAHALSNVHFLLKHPFDAHLGSKLRFIKDCFLIRLIQASKGRLYHRLKPWILKTNQKNANHH